MRDLDQKIAEWRRKMLAAGITSPVPLDELENHLRDDIEQQAQSGLDAQQAFNNAVRRIGEAPSLKNEFRKISRVAGKRVRRIILLAGVLVVLWGVAAILPALGKHERRGWGAWADDEVFGLVLGVTFVVAGAGTAVLSLTKREI